MRRLIITLLLCLAGAVLNNAASRLIYKYASPVYIDTIFTVALTMACRLSPGIFHGAFSNPLAGITSFRGREECLFIVCNIAAALVLHPVLSRALIIRREAPPKQAVKD